jgi:hypothetical protein
MSLNGFGYANASPTMNTDPTGVCVPPVTVTCVIVALPTIEAGVIVIWAAAVAGIGVLTYVATHDQIFRAEGKEDTSSKNHVPIPEGKIDEHQVKKDNDVPEGVDLYWGPETGDVDAHPKDPVGRITGEGDKIGSWDIDQYPKRKGPR